MHSSVYFLILSDSDTALFLTGGSAIPLSVAGRPINGAGDEVKMGPSVALSEYYFPNRLAKVAYFQTPAKSTNGT
jgi:hypothetical protein